MEGEEGESEAQGWAGTGSAATEMALQGMGKLLDVDNQKNWRAQGSLQRVSSCCRYKRENHWNRSGLPKAMRTWEQRYPRGS